MVAEIDTQLEQLTTACPADWSPNRQNIDSKMKELQQTLKHLSDQVGVDRYLLKQEDRRLERALGLPDLVLYGIVLIQPTAPMPPFGVVSQTAHGHVVTTILIWTPFKRVCNRCNYYFVLWSYWNWRPG